MDRIAGIKTVCGTIHFVQYEIEKSVAILFPTLWYSFLILQFFIKSFYTFLRRITGEIRNTVYFNRVTG
jgi:hypothetical protein